MYAGARTKTGRGGIGGKGERESQAGPMPSREPHLGLYLTTLNHDLSCNLKSGASPAEHPGNPLCTAHLRSCCPLVKVLFSQGDTARDQATP